MRMLEHSFEPEAGVRRVEGIMGTGRRRRWSVDDRAQSLRRRWRRAATSEVARRTGCRRSRFLAGDEKPSGALAHARPALRHGAGIAGDTGRSPAGSYRDYRRSVVARFHGGGRGEADPGRAGAEGGVMIVPGVGAEVPIVLRPVDFRRRHGRLGGAGARQWGPILLAGRFTFSAASAPIGQAAVLGRHGAGAGGQRLEDGSFRLPSLRDGVMRLTPAQLSALLEGLDWAPGARGENAD